MEIYHFEQIVLDWPISVELKRYGLDWMVQITGGCAPHIGRVSGGTVSVVCGIHYDMPGKEGLRQIVDCTERLLQEIQHRLVAAQSD